MADLGRAVEEIYWLKEAISDWYNIKDHTIAEATLDILLSQIDSLSPTIDFIHGFLITVGIEWRERILNYFYHRITTGYLEKEVQAFKQRFALWSVSGDFEHHIVRMLLKDGPISAENTEDIAWRTAAAFRPMRRIKEAL